MKIGKRKMLIYIVVLIAVIGFAVYCLYSKALNNEKNETAVSRVKAGEELTFFVATDIHYLAKELQDGGAAFRRFVEEGDGKQLNYIDEITEAFFRDVKRQKPQVLILSGDLTNNGEEKSHQELAKKLKQIEQQGTSVYVIPGNHDIDNPWARSFREDKQVFARGVSPKEFTQIYNSYGYKEAISQDKDTLSYLAAPSEEVWLLMLDTCLYNNNRVFGVPQSDGELGPDTLKWVQSCVDLAKQNHAMLIPVTHHNLLDHSEVIAEGYTLNNNEEVLDLLVQSDIRFSLSGHIHIQDISSRGNFYDIVTNALSVHPQQYGVLKYMPAHKRYQYSTADVDVEGWAAAANSEDPNLKNFDSYSKDFFGQRAYRMAANFLKERENYNLEEKKQMAETVSLMNIRYFAGRENDNEKDVLHTTGYKLWQDVKEGFFRSYLDSIAGDEDTEDNYLNIQLK